MGDEPYAYYCYCCAECGDECSDEYETCACGEVFCPECYEVHFIECDEAQNQM